MPDGRRRRVIFRGDELNILIIHVQVVERFLDQVGVLVLDMPEVGRGNADVHDAVTGMRIAGGLQPGIVRVPVDFFFRAHPGCATTD